jgi:S-adenosylmethionine uptake transporter
MVGKKINAPLGASLVVLSSVFYGAYGVWYKLLGDYFGAFTQAALRHAITAAILVGFAICLKKLEHVHWRRDARWFALSAFTAAIIPSAWYYAVLHSGVGVSAVLLYVGLVIGMFFFGWWFSNERFTRDKALATALGMTGTLLIFAPHLGGGSWLALMAAFIGGFASGLNVVASKKMPYNGSQTAAIAWTLGLLVNVPFIFIFGEPLDVFHWDISWLYLLIFGVTSVVASWSLIQGVKLIEAGAAGILGLLEIVFGVLFGVVLFGERPGVVVLLGMILILIAAAIPYFRDYNARKGTLEEPKA